MATPKTVLKYGAQWASHLHHLQIELECIKMGGRWKSAATGLQCGAGLFEHYLNVRKICWPHLYVHRWTRLYYQTILENQIVVLMGSASSQKSSAMAEMALISYWADPHNTAVIVSSTTREKLEKAVFGEIKKRWAEAHKVYGFLSGNPVEYKQMITTDDKDEEEIRDERKGIFAVACQAKANNGGLGAYAGIKQKKMWFFCDELQFMAPTFLDCLPNLQSNTSAGGLHFVGSGNPDHNSESPLGIMAEPVDGWSSVESIEKTTVWKIKKRGGVCVNLIGTDSPNFDHEEDVYPGLIGRDFEEIIAHDYGKDSPQYESQVKGRMKLNLTTNRVITRQICQEHRAFDKAIWAGGPRTRVYAVDPSYGGGDRCVAGYCEFGPDPEGKMIFKVNEPRIIRINLRDEDPPEDQIAKSVYDDLERYNIPAKHCFYDSFGKGTVGFAFARVFGHDCPIPIDSSSHTTSRPVRQGLKIKDEARGEMRLKRCDEHFSKFVTEMWFSTRYAIEAEQVRELPEKVMTEGTWREYYTVAGGKIEVETKDKIKKKGARSPDLFDWLCYCMEGARRLGFVISIVDHTKTDKVEPDWLDIEAEKYNDVLASKLLVHS